MASIVIRKLPEETKARLREQAARHGRSMEEEARTILTLSLTGPAETGNLAEIASRFFGPAHGVDLEWPQFRLGAPVEFCE